MTITTTGTAAAWSPDEFVFAATDVVPTALILEASTIAGDINGDQPSLHVGYIDDHGRAETYLEATEIDDAAPQLDEVLIRTTKIARLATVSNEQYSQGPAATQIAASLARDLAVEADRRFLTARPDDTGPGGLLLAEGATESPSPVTGSLDVLTDLLGQLESLGSQPSMIVTDPLGWAAIRKFKTGDGHNATLLGAGTSDAEPRLLGLPVRRARWMPPTTGLVIDRASIPAAVGPVRAAVSEHAAFTRDSVTLRATWRFGWTVLHPERLGRFRIADTTASH